MDKKSIDMTYREYMAGQALNALLRDIKPGVTDTAIAKAAVMYADAAIAELAREEADPGVAAE
jgi:hypothetical protein